MCFTVRTHHFSPSVNYRYSGSNIFLSLLDNKLLTFNDKLFQNTFSCWCSGYHISLKLIDKASNQKIASSIHVEVEHFDPYTGCASIVCVGDCY